MHTHTHTHTQIHNTLHKIIRLAGTYIHTNTQYLHQKHSAGWYLHTHKYTILTPKTFGWLVPTYTQIHNTYTKNIRLAGTCKSLRNNLSYVRDIFSAPETPESPSAFARAIILSSMSVTPMTWSVVHMYVCMYVCIFVCVSHPRPCPLCIYMYVSIYVCMYVCVCVCVSRTRPSPLCIRMYVCVCVHVTHTTWSNMHVYACMYGCVRVYIYICMYACI
jgi:hypothetical protein